MGVLKGAGARAYVFWLKHRLRSPAARIECFTTMRLFRKSLILFIPLFPYL